jgi:hypothetical protein
MPLAVCCGRGQHYARACVSSAKQLVEKLCVGRGKAEATQQLTDVPSPERALLSLSPGSVGVLRVSPPLPFGKWSHG